MPALPERSASDTHSLGRSRRPTAGSLRPREQEPVGVADSAGLSSQAVLWKHTMDAMVPGPTGGLLGLRLARLAARGVLGANGLRRVHHPCRALWFRNVPSPGLGRRGNGLGRGEGRGVGRGQPTVLGVFMAIVAKGSPCLGAAQTLQKPDQLLGPRRPGQVGRQAGRCAAHLAAQRGLCRESLAKCRQSYRPCEAREGNGGTGRACPSRGLRCPRPSVLPLPPAPVTGAGPGLPPPASPRPSPRSGYLSSGSKILIKINLPPF